MYIHDDIENMNNNVLYISFVLHNNYNKIKCTNACLYASGNLALLMADCALSTLIFIRLNKNLIDAKGGINFRVILRFLNLTKTSSHALFTSSINRSVEVERILKDQNLEQIDDVVGHLSEVPLGSILETNILDSGIAKYFLLSQFSVQYLLFCRTFLAETVNDLRESHGSAQMEVATLKRSLSEANNEILQLHKKITQMEAIHEVIYPCHLCTKNFISNDALNLHISRKHNTKVERKPETPCLIAKEREHDLNLINTIKLELEIKQLKERLNNAEREIKEKSLSNSKRSTPQPPNRSPKRTEELKSTQSIGIQSNLTELKEKDDNNENVIEHKDQILILQAKLNDFETWKQRQKEENSEFFRDIHQKLGELTEAFEACKNRKEKTQDEIEQEVHNVHSTAPSIEHLEDLLSRKVEDISKQSSDKLEKMILKLQQNYKEKLEEMQNDFKKVAAVNIENNNQIQQLQKKNTADVEGIKRSEEDDKDREREITFVAEEAKSKESISSSSNRTFVKTAPTILKKNATISVSISDSENDEDSSTNISESLEEENPGIASTSCKKSIQPGKTFIMGQEQSYHNKTEKVSKNIKIKPKTVIREDVMKMTNTRLKAMGVDAKTKGLSQTSLKRLTSELNEKRNRMTQKYPNFHATRDKIRKFVDKLCSSKMPASAQILLEQTRPKKPKEDNKEKSENSDNDETDDDEGASPIQVSTPVNETTIPLNNNEFKERLERILASPIKKPDNYKHHIVKAMVHQEGNRPVPFPRKKVMFEHANVATEHTENGEVPIIKSKSSHRLLSDDNLRSLL
uniref:C2H2-type domain-containing protein n=1 Tax=Glossina austeni TaxID=7395 RepID=A0A1A9V641_GLOAU